MVSEAAVLEVIQGGHQAMNAEAEASSSHVESRKTQANRDKRQARKRRLAADREELARHRSSTGSGSKGAPTQKGKGKGKVLKSATVGRQAVEAAPMYLQVENVVEPLNGSISAACAFHRRTRMRTASQAEA